MTQDTFTFYAPKMRSHTYIEEKLFELQYGMSPNIKLNHWYRFKSHTKNVMV